MSIKNYDVFDAATYEALEKHNEELSAAREVEARNKKSNAQPLPCPTCVDHAMQLQAQARQAAAKHVRNLAMKELSKERRRDFTGNPLPYALQGRAGADPSGRYPASNYPKQDPGVPLVNRYPNNYPDQIWPPGSQEQRQRAVAVDLDAEKTRAKLFGYARDEKGRRCCPVCGAPWSSIATEAPTAEPVDQVDQTGVSSGAIVDEATRRNQLLGGSLPVALQGRRGTSTRAVSLNDAVANRRQQLHGRPGGA